MKNLLLAIASALITGGCSGEDQLSALPQDGDIQVYFNHNQTAGSVYTDYRGIERSGDNLEQLIIDGINNAQTSIDLAVQQLNLPSVAEALVAKAHDGVRVRVVVENEYNVADAALSILKRSGKVQLIDDTADGSKGSGLMHHKFMVIDRAQVITGSANFTFSGIHGDGTDPNTMGNVNHLMVIDSGPIAEAFTGEFNLLWQRKFGLQKPPRPPQTFTVGNNQITLKFSPASPSTKFAQTTNGLIAQTLNQAQSSVDLALFVFSDQTIVNSLKNRVSQGITVRALIDQRFAFNDYSEGLDMLGVAMPNKDCKYETGNAPWSAPITTMGTVNLPDGDKLHHKIAIVDETTVITGSHNWSAAANHNNDETLIIIKNPTVAQHFDREFETLYSNSTLGLPDRVISKIQKKRRQCAL
ncbi:MAG: DUF1669 domain-containing protein [Synechococcaceae cyanobacterium RL_1_2]|nr:DUF1669 domain-containing protein [Synechococcaceae cyanobacterium RL_1_2]